MSEQIKFICRRDGTTKVEVSGTTGTKCVEMTKPFEALLGTGTSQKKQEFHMEGAAGAEGVVIGHR